MQWLKRLFCKHQQWYTWKMYKKLNGTIMNSEKCLECGKVRKVR